MDCKSPFRCSSYCAISAITPKLREPHLFSNRIRSTDSKSSISLVLKVIDDVLAIIEDDTNDIDFWFKMSQIMRLLCKAEKGESELLFWWQKHGTDRGTWRTISCLFLRLAGSKDTRILEKFLIRACLVELTWRIMVCKAFISYSRNRALATKLTHGLHNKIYTIFLVLSTHVTLPQRLLDESYCLLQSPVYWSVSMNICGEESITPFVGCSVRGPQSAG